MVDVLYIIAIVLAGFIVVPALAHALELPGKMRLSEAEYRIVQRIYYPGFTLAGIAEACTPIVTLVLLFWVPVGGSEFYLLLVAFLSLLCLQAVFWLLTQPVNRRWVGDIELNAAGTRFFAASRRTDHEPPFHQLRARWEYSHLVRAALAVVSLVTLAIAATHTAGTSGC